MKQRLILVPVLLAGIVFALVFAPEKWKERMDFSNSTTVVDASARERLNAWAFARHLAADYPITGGGFATFTPELFSRYAPNGTDIKGPHSVYFGLLAEHGYIGLTIYLTLVLSCFATARALAREARIRKDRVVLEYIHMFRFSMVGFLVSGVFLGRAYFDYFFTVVACLTILARVARQQWLLEAEEPAADSGELEDSEMPLPENGAYVWRG